MTVYTYELVDGEPDENGEFPIPDLRVHGEQSLELPDDVAEPIARLLFENPTGNTAVDNETVEHYGLDKDPA